MSIKTHEEILKPLKKTMGALEKANNQRVIATQRNAERIKALSEENTTHANEIAANKEVLGRFSRFIGIK